MPLCKREGFDVSGARKDALHFHDNEEVFFCEVTKEIFRDYEDYFRHVMVINSTVWQCEATGQDNLTYAEALKSERRARNKMELFKDCLRPPLMLVIEQAQQSSFKSLNVIAFKFLRKRYFHKEEVMLCHTNSKHNTYTVEAIVPPGEAAPANGVYEETEKLQYRLRRVDNTTIEVVVPYENLRRRRSEFTAENLQMFIKHNVIRVDGILRPKPDSYKKYVTDRKLSFGTIFIGKMPTFTPAKLKRPQANDNSKKQSTMNKYLVKSQETAEKGTSKAIAQEQARREREKAAEAKAKSLKEQMERIRREKQEKLAELERVKAEKRAKLLERIEAECNALLTKTDDLERTDQRLLPTFEPIQTYIPKYLLGDALMLREFMHSFVNILSGIDLFRNNLTFYELSRALTVHEVGGPLSDILVVFLSTVFDLQKEEEDKCAVSYLTMRKEMCTREPYQSMSQAARAHQYTKRHHASKINDLPVDALTLSEVLRLHLLSSGASVIERNEKWRMVYRNGYTSSEDPGLALRMQYPHILRALKLYTIYQLPFVDVVRVLSCLISQILTYSGTLAVIEDRMEQMAKARIELRTLATTENRRLANVEVQKRAMMNEYSQQCMDEAVKNDLEQKRQLEEKLNKRLGELQSQSNRERRKYRTQVEKLNVHVLNNLMFLGMDRAYRKYYVLVSMPGIYVEHPAECMDCCLSDPPKNAPTALTANMANLPKTRKELRSYLLKMYTEEEKRLAITEKSEAKNAIVVGVAGSQENKENQENLVLNGLTNGHGLEPPTVSNGVEVKEEGNSDADSHTSQRQTRDRERELATVASPPTQYQLYMCTGDPRNCIVHDERNTDRQRWAYIYENDDIDALIESLNPLGERESQLREQLISLRQMNVFQNRKSPSEVFSIDAKKMAKFKTYMMSETQRKYGKGNFGYNDDDLNIVLYAALADRVLQFENDIYTGDLGRLKVKDMQKWREDVRNNTYEAQGKLQWGTGIQKMTASGGNAEEEDELDEYDDEDSEADVKDGGQYANKPYRDPGNGLGETLQIDSEDSAEEEISLHESDTLLTSISNLASALLQVEQAIERRFIKEPFGATFKEGKVKEFLDRKMKQGADRLKQWEISLMQSTSYSQVSLHLNVLHDSIVWARSTSKSICKICRRGSDPDKMLLCDECNGGTHMFCMKPKMKTVPEGNWYCNSCIKLLGLQIVPDENKRPARKRRSSFALEDVEDNCSETSSTSSISKNVSGRIDGTRSGRKQMLSHEIEEMLQEDEEEAEDDEAADIADGSDGEGEVSDEEAVEETDSDENDEDDEGLTDVNNETQLNSQEESDSNSLDEDGDVDEEQEEDECVCVVCSYDGADLFCIRCKDNFHLECINLKRPPRYNYTCNKCKARDEKRRKTKPNDNSSDEDDNSEDAEPSTMRTRQSRSSLRNSPQDSKDGSNKQRRSYRRNGGNLPLNSALLYGLLEEIMKHEQAWPFLRAVSQSEVPDYHKIIKNPMDFARVKSKLNMGEYQLNEEVLNDIQLIFNNCDQYNVKDNEIYQAGFILEQFIIGRCRDLDLPFKPSDMNEQ